LLELVISPLLHVAGFDPSLATSTQFGVGKVPLASTGVSSVPLTGRKSAWFHKAGVSVIPFCEVAVVNAALARAAPVAL
jgi:hypothetical protein